jgi:hypothetical protein
MLHAGSLSGSLALLLWCSSDENGELTHIEKNIGRESTAHSTQNRQERRRRRTNAA